MKHKKPHIHYRTSKKGRRFVVNPNVPKRIKKYGIYQNDYNYPWGGGRNAAKKRLKTELKRYEDSFNPSLFKDEMDEINAQLNVMDEEEEY